MRCNHLFPRTEQRNWAMPQFSDGFEFSLGKIKPAQSAKSTPSRQPFILHGHAGGMPAIAGKLNLVSRTFAIWAAILATLLRCAVASRVGALVLPFRSPVFGDFFSGHGCAHGQLSLFLSRLNSQCRRAPFCDNDPSVDLGASHGGAIVLLCLAERL
jgi:hypothetical protein